ncbi:MAG: MBL fold metallo-hydrolase [Proteobacteria bacterium]|nr:MBL fold metallo-hydrolase [Pseudomonadota bacterium]MBU0965816.1 MBL fold metallo-hydrolase [Pseudomonadota bacterium]
MQFCVLGSGSKGNATYVASQGRAFLIDNGFSGVEIERRLAAIGVETSSLTAILLTHAHSDHIKGAAVLARKYKLPIYANKGTLDVAAKSLGAVPAIHEFHTGISFDLHHFHIHPFAICHDCADPVGFVIENGFCTLGYCTDTGMVSRLIQHRLAGCNGLIIECNHDPAMLKNGPYPLYLQQRVRSNQGHLANEEAARFVADLLHDGLQHVVLAHISETNNHPALAYDTISAVLKSGKEALTGISLAWQDRAGELITLKDCIGHGED